MCVLPYELETSTIVTDAPNEVQEKPMVSMFSYYGARILTHTGQVCVH